MTSLVAGLSWVPDQRWADHHLNLSYADAVNVPEEGRR
jgi:hypothetical protein